VTAVLPMTILSLIVTMSLLLTSGVVAVGEQHAVWSLTSSAVEVSLSYCQADDEYKTMCGYVDDDEICCLC